MSEKNTPVWIHQSPTEKIQIGVASDPIEGVAQVDIWPEFQELKIKDFTIGDAPVPERLREFWDEGVVVEAPSEVPENQPEPEATEVPEVKTTNDGDPANDNDTDAEPAECALAEPKKTSD